jgi:hypothetical protein
MTSTFQTLLATGALALFLTATSADARPRATAKTTTTPANTATTAASSAKHGVGRGDMEFGVFADYSNYDDTKANTFLLGASIGRFLRDSLELRITPSILYSESPGVTLIGFTPYVSAEYLFRGASMNNPVVPYVGIGIGLDITSINATSYDIFQYGLFLTPVGGVKAFVSERTSLEYALSFQLEANESCTSATCTSGNSNTLQNTLRFNIYY